MLGEGSELCECSWLYSAAVLAHAAEQSFPRGAEGSILPARVPRPGVALLPLQPPLEGVSRDPPGRVELGYEAIGGVRWALGVLLVVSMRRRCRRPLAHRCFGSSLIAGGNGGTVALPPCGSACLSAMVEFISTRTVSEHITRTFCGQAFLIRVLRRSQLIEETGAPDRIRTCDLCLRRATLYPTELRVLVART